MRTFDFALFHDDDSLAILEDMRLIGRENNRLSLHGLKDTRLEDRRSHLRVALQPPIGKYLVSAMRKRGGGDAMGVEVEQDKGMKKMERSGGRWKDWGLELMGEYRAKRVIEEHNVFVSVQGPNIDPISNRQTCTDTRINKYLAKLIRCFCPPDKLIPLSPISVMSPAGKSLRSWTSSHAL